VTNLLIILLVLVGAFVFGVASVIVQLRRNRLLAEERSVRQSLGLPVSNISAGSSNGGPHGAIDTSSGSDCGSIGGCD
jgi:hypothetical protein